MNTPKNTTNHSLNQSQKMFFVIYFTFSIFFVIMDQIYKDADLVRYFKYAVMITLCLSVNLIKKIHKEQKIIAFSFFFSVIADFFLVFSPTIDSWKLPLAPIGILSFSVAYVILTTVYSRNFRIKTPEIITGIPIVFLVIFMLYYISDFVKGYMFVLTIIFAIIISIMVWSGISTLYRGYYKKQIAWFMAISSSLMFLSDLGVAFALFDPYFSKHYVPFLDNYVWITYIPAWAILAAIVSSYDIRGQFYKKS